MITDRNAQTLAQRFAAAEIAYTRLVERYSYTPNRVSHAKLLGHAIERCYGLYSKDKMGRKFPAIHSRLGEMRKKALEFI